MAAIGSPQDSDFFDVEPLPFSGVSLELEGLHDMLEDSELEDNEIEVNVDEEDVDYFPFTNFNSSYNIMDSTEILGNSRCDTIQENEKMHCASKINAKQYPSSIPQLARCDNGHFIPINAVNFDPPTSIYVRKASHSDVSMCSYTTTRTNSSTPAEDFDAQYCEALHSLAESMKRSEESRQYIVKIKREVLTLEQRTELSLAKTRLEKQNQQVQSSFMAALEESRKKLGIYLGHMSQQTL
jgi:hypothetical protein